MSTKKGFRINRALFAYFAALLFALHLITYFIPSIRDATVANAPLIAEPRTVVAIAAALVLFPVVAALPTPEWVRYAGYGWLGVEVVTEIMQLNDAPTSLTFLSLRYGGHILAGAWIIAASWRSDLLTKIVGSLLALIIVLYSFTAFLPAVAVILLPTPVLYPLWFVLIGLGLTRQQQHPRLQLESQQRQLDPIG
ncbi:hypothetical protein EI42_06220 [Thermosporothrix hazakensis]|jgi:hypothetical protein|uniref:Uncharacterized protein n=1 Tax=Thermosporothrix hazakensis TaxID=644383 RepID=A0A326TP71_THEHA|nr:hypothetical protein [Thermosporothrix hazakensis]PZW18303.1 hypothetical protein EI42_06220 [Thermosporothrix hazakensis]GCE51429.1 hypothetical protein KTH_62980 [Thermosporothrix hazakensis]